MSDDTSMPPFDELQQRLMVIRDRVRGVAFRQSNGFYLFGRAGTSKTHTVKTTLDDLDIKYAYQSGHLTEIGLFELMAENHDRTILLDDVSSIFNQKIGLQLLLAALGNQPSDRGTRIIKYKRQGRDETIHFTGGIIAISNLELHKAPVLAALKSRVNYLKYDPTDQQLESLMMDVASKGWTANAGSMTPTECLEVADFLIAQSHQLNVRLDMRNLVDKAFPDYLQHRTECSEAHWKDLIRTTLEEQLVDLKHTTELNSRDSTKRWEQMLVRSIVKDQPDRQSRLAKWIDRTGKSERAFYRRLAEIDGLTD